MPQAAYVFYIFLIFFGVQYFAGNLYMMNSVKAHSSYFKSVCSIEVIMDLIRETLLENRESICE